jgi:hypothetical protein
VTIEQVRAIQTALKLALNVLEEDDDTPEAIILRRRLSSTLVVANESACSLLVA